MSRSELNYQQRCSNLLQKTYSIQKSGFSIEKAKLKKTPVNLSCVSYDQINVSPINRQNTDSSKYISYNIDHIVICPIYTLIAY